MPTVAFYTLGCKLNQYETQTVRERFERAGWQVVPFTQAADVYVVNTCAVTARSAANSRKAVRRALRLAPRARVVAVGCDTQLEPEAFARIPGVAAVLGNRNKVRALEFLAAPLPGQIVVDRPDDDARFEDFDIRAFYDHSRAFVKVQEGCDAHCAYCVVPLVRGKLKSRLLPGILAQAEKLTANGYREIVVTGTHLGLYGKDLGDKTTLQDVLQALIKVPGLVRLRVSSLEPQELTPELIEFLATERKICRHLHIPLQSGDDSILTAMRRRYTAGAYRSLVRLLSGKISGLGLGTDVIVGFPGETAEQFGHTAQLLSDLPFTYFHVFPFSPRPGTSAAKLPGQVAVPEVRQRVKELMALRSAKITAFRCTLRGTMVPVLVQSKRDRKTGKLIGLSDNYLEVAVEANEEQIGSILNVRVP